MIVDSRQTFPNFFFHQITLKIRVNFKNKIGLKMLIIVLQHEKKVLKHLIKFLLHKKCNLISLQNAQITSMEIIGEREFCHGE